MLSPGGSFDYVNYTMITIPATLTNNIFSGTIALGTSAEAYGAIAGISQEEDTPNVIANNYYTTGTIGGINNADVTENDGAVFAVIREIEGYGSGNDKWAFIASPVAGSVTPGNVHNLLGQMITESPMLYDFDLYRLEPATTMWENYNNSEHTTGFILVNGYGYLYATKETKTLMFAGNFNTGDSETETVGLSEGFNLVGNPFIVEAYVNRPYYKMNASGTAVELVTDITAIAPCTGVMVEYKDGNQVVFTKTSQSSQANQGALNIAVAQSNMRGTSATAAIDKAIITFNESSELGKFYFGTQAANIYIPQGTEEYAIAFSNAQGEMPVNFKANQDGEYTLSINANDAEMSYLHLIDNMTGTDIDLLQTPSYTFNATTRDYESRFKLVFASSSIEEIDGDSDTFAFFSNGNWIIANEGQATLQVIDITGRILSSESISGSVSKAIDATAGVYMIRLINGENVKVQKIVVR